MNNQIETIDPDTGEVLSVEGKLQSPGSPVELSVISAEINQQIATARRYPRRKDKIIAQEIVERATLNEEIASECVYKLPPRGGNEIPPGPSIRLAEIVRASYWNVRVASRYVGIDERVRGRAMVVVEAVAMDMQTNDAVLLSVSRSIMTSSKKGPPQMFSPDMVNVTMMAAQSIAQRDATLRLIPKALWIGGFHAALATVRGEMSTLSERRSKMLRAFLRYSIKPDELFAAIGVSSEHEIGLDHMVDLTGMWTALKEGDHRDVVLGRAAERSGAADRAVSEPVRNPLDDKPKNGKLAEDGIGVPLDIRQPEPSTANLEAARTSAVAEKQHEKPSELEADFPQDLAGPADAGYFAVALDVIAKATNATKLRGFWKTERVTREKAQLTGTQTTQLHEAYERKLDEIEGRG